MFHLCRPDRRFRLVVPARPGPARGRGSARRRRRDLLSGKRAGRRRCRARTGAPRTFGLRHHLHHLVRLHGCDEQGRGQVSRHQVRACDRLQARARERRDLQLEVPRGPLRPGRDRGQPLQGRRGGLHRLVPDPRGGDGHQRVRARGAVRQSRLQGQGRVGQYLVRPGQGSRRRQGADRPGCRHHHPAHRFDRSDAGGFRARHQGVRPGVRHDQVRPGDPAHLDRR